MAKVSLADCMKPHPTLHLVKGIGVGLLLAGLFTGLGGQTGVVLGIVLIVGALAAHWFVKM